PVATQMFGVGSCRRCLAFAPVLEKVTAEPEGTVDFSAGEFAEDIAGKRAGAQLQLMPAGALQLDVQSVVAAGAEPVIVPAAVAVLQAQVKPHRQFKMMDASGVAEDQIEFAKGLAVLADRKVGFQQVYIRCLAQRELPEAFVIQPQP